MLEVIVILILLNTTLLHCASKWKILEWFALHRKSWMPSADCFLCLSFWMGVIQALVFCIYVPSWWLLLLPFCVASGTNWLVNQALLNDYIK